MKVLVWGTGELATKYMTYYNEKMKDTVEILGFIDNYKKSFFFGFPILTFEKALEYTFDYIVLLNVHTYEIMEQIQRTIGTTKNVLSMNEFFRVYMRESDWNKKNVLFIGDKIQYSIMEYRAKFTFKKICYNENIPCIDKEVDAIFLCPPVLISEEKRLEYEINIKNKLLNDNKIVKENIYFYTEWFFYLIFDREIGKGYLNQNINFFVIAVSSPMQGWGNILLRILANLTYAKENNLIPVIDMQNMKNQYLKDEYIGKINSWEYYFEQVTEYTLNEIYNSKNVVLVGLNSHSECTLNYSNIKMRSEIENIIENLYKKKFSIKDKVLGVVYRATDYYVAYDHVKPKSIEEFILFVKEYMKEIGYKYIFLATEVEEAVEDFQIAFGNHLSFVEQKRYSSKEREWLYKIKFERDNDEYLKGLEYLTVLELLSRCNSLLAMDTGAARAAIAMNENKYENVRILY